MKTRLNVILFGLIIGTHAWAQDSSAIDQAFDVFWGAESTAEAEAAVADILASGVSFEEAYRRLQAGKTHEETDTGVVLRSYYSTDGTQYYYHLNVPEDYDPAREYQVRFELHGGIGGRQNNRPGGRGGGHSRLEDGSPNEIAVMPYAWLASPWWDDSQVENVRNILDLVKREYNIDENRVILGGISDGATGTWYIGMRESTRFAAYYSFIGYVMVLANPSIADGRSFLQNLLGKPWYAINGALDRLYPTSRVTPVIDYLQNGGVNIEYHPLPEGEHNTRWWPDWRDDFVRFEMMHPRDPNPDLISWKATQGLHNRSHWLIIEQLDASQHSPVPLFEVGIDPGNGTRVLAMDAAGRVDVSHIGNEIQALTDGVGSFRLLLSPEEFDLTQPINVTVNNEVKFHGTLTPSLETLLTWAARDNDRKMLYAAELVIDL